MKSKLGLLLAVAALALVPAQQSRAYTGNLAVTGKVGPALTVTSLTTLDFGEVIPGAVLGSVTVTPLGVGSTVSATQIGTPVNGTFTVTGRGSRTLSGVTFTNSTINCSNVADPVNDCIGGTNTVTISAGTHDWNLVMPVGGGRVTTAPINLGATMSVAANQDSGLYAGNFVVNLFY